MDQHAWPNRRISLQSVWSMALSAMMVECEQIAKMVGRTVLDVVSGTSVISNLIDEIA